MLRLLRALTAPLVTLFRGSSDAERHLDAGVRLRNDSRLEEAIAEYNEAIRLDPEYTGAYMNRGNVYHALGQHERAIEDYNQAIRIDPQDADAYVGRAMVHAVLGMDLEARQDIDRAAELGVDRSDLESEIERIKSQQ